MSSKSRINNSNLNTSSSDIPIEFYNNQGRVKTNKPYSAKKQFSDDDIFALPSEEEVDSSFLVEDGHFRKKTSRVISRSSKVNTEYAGKSNSEQIALTEKSHIQKFIGRKGFNSWSKDIKELRTNFGFTWQRLGRRLLVSGVLITTLFLVSLGGGAAVALNIWSDIESINELEASPVQNSVVYARDGKTKIFEYFDEEKREIIDGKEIPQIMKSAIIALEDENYYHNQEKESWQKGIPWSNLAGASLKCFFSAGDECRGASGISQQLIKNMTKDNEQNIDRKVRELFRAIKLNQEKTPDEILGSYLNWVPFGRNAYGVQEASKAYFSRPINERDENGNFVLTAPEACYLAAIVNKPGYYQNGVNKLSKANERKINGINAIVTEGTSEEQVIAEEIIPAESLDLETRKDICLNKLNELKLRVPKKDENGNILVNGQGEPILTEGRVIETKQELEELKNMPVAITDDKETAQKLREEGKVAFVNQRIDDPYPHFRAYITEEIEKVVSQSLLNRNGYEIVTSLDPQIQSKVEEIVRGNKGLIEKYGANNAAAMVMDGDTGEILAMIGSLDYNNKEIDGKVNIATSPQQPGSSIKPYVYMNAFDNGFNPGNIIIDTQTTWNGNYTPKNFDGGYSGAISLRAALQGSLNIPAVKTLFLGNDAPATDQKSKLNDFFNFAEDLGLEFPCVNGAANSPLVFIENKGIERCYSNSALGISQTEIDKIQENFKKSDNSEELPHLCDVYPTLEQCAYRSRCGISSALGGCEITMVSHTTAFNTILQEGSLRTATPFVSIKPKGEDRDIYIEAQNNADNKKQPFPKINLDPNNEKDLEKILLARQMTDVMTDYELRAAEFGNSRFNIEVDNYTTKVAAKTGTSNGPRDFWTLGGSKHYTVSVWVGRTDNGLMNKDITSVYVAAPIWKEIMEFLHAEKEAVPFSTEGLVQPSGSRYLITPKQSGDRYFRKGVVAIETSEDLEKFKQRDIFDNRSAVITATYFINKVDGKLFADGKNLDSNKEQVECQMLIGEFPQLPNWHNPIAAIAEASSSYCTLPELSDQDQVNDNSQLDISTNLFSNQTIDISEIIINAGFDSLDSTKLIERMEVYRNNNLILGKDINNSSTTEVFGVAEGGPYDFVIKVYDNTGEVITKSFNNVTISSNKVSNLLTDKDLGPVQCTPQPAIVNQLVTCSFTILDQTKDYSFVNLRVSNSIVTCTPSANKFSCSLNISNSGTYPITIIIDGRNYNQSSTLQVS